MSEKARKLVEVTKDSLDAAIRVCGPGVEFKKVGDIIQGIADKNK